VQWLLRKLQLWRVHDGLSHVTNLRKYCLPWEGTFDFWVLAGITGMNILSVYVGVSKLRNKDAIFSLKGCENENIQMIALVFAFIEATPGLLFIMCASTCPRVLTHKKGRHV
jgi:hypothetical protein